MFHNTKERKPWQYNRNGRDSSVAKNIIESSGKLILV